MAAKHVKTQFDGLLGFCRRSTLPGRVSLRVRPGAKPPCPASRACTSDAAVWVQARGVTTKTTTYLTAASRPLRCVQLHNAPTRRPLSTSSPAKNATTGASGKSSIALSIVVSAAALLALSLHSRPVYADSPAVAHHSEQEHVHDEQTFTTSFEDSDDSCRKIRLAELPKHNGSADTKWVVRDTKVYDITGFVDGHPGGEVILRACGGPIDTYWKLIPIHQKKDVYDILDQYYIGDIDERDIDDSGRIDWSIVGYEDIGDPFKDDPARDERLIVHTEKPCNAETPGNLLTDFLTPLHLFFVRNHLWVPKIQADKHEITIELSNGDEKTYTLHDLKSRFASHTITATLQCAGNRRGHMSKSQHGATSGLQWATGAVGTAEFTGVRLRDVLRDAGYDVESRCQGSGPKGCTDKHVHFTAPSDTYAASIPLQTALNPTSDVLLVWDMNGLPLDRDHGGPLRAVVPGTTSARSVKWVGKVSISDEEATSQWQRRDYKVFPPSVRARDVTAADWEKQQSIQEMVVQSAISAIRSDPQQRTTAVHGWALSGGGRAITRVDVSADGGKTWKQASLREDDAKGMKRWAWTRWSAQWTEDELERVEKNARREFVCRAVDEAYNTQPETFESTWNFRGLCASAWHRVDEQP